MYCKRGGEKYYYLNQIPKLVSFLSFLSLATCNLPHSTLISLLIYSRPPSPAPPVCPTLSHSLESTVLEDVFRSFTSVKVTA